MREMSVERPEQAGFSRRLSARFELQEGGVKYREQCRSQMSNRLSRSFCEQCRSQKERDKRFDIGEVACAAEQFEQDGFHGG